MLMMLKQSSLLILLVSFYLVSSFATASRFDDCYLSDTERCSIDSLAKATRIFTGGVCLYSKPYNFQVHPGYGENKEKVVVHFQGGGYCVSLTLCQLDRNTENIVFVDVQDEFGGIYDDTKGAEDGNPFWDWTKIVINYCSGDLHRGDAVFFWNTPRLRTIMTGRLHATTALDWLETNIPSPTRILFTGCSAGSLGLQMWASYLLERYSALPEPPMMSFLMDGFLGLMPAAQSLAYIRWNMCTAEDLPPELVEECLQGRFTVSDGFVYAQSSFPNIPFAFLSYKDDYWQRMSYCYGACTQQNHYRAMKDLLLEYDNDGAENVISHLVDGAGHCTLMLNEFYADNDKMRAVRDWVTALANYEYDDELYSYCREDLFDCDPILSTKNFTADELAPRRPTMY